jgi:cephalosporin hydroxylase
MAKHIASKKPLIITACVILFILVLMAILLTIPFRKSELGSDRDIQSATTRFNRVYYDSMVWRVTKYLGIPTQQFPTDLWMIQEIITQLKPDLIIETGTYHGGSTLFYADILDRVNERGRVITIDIDPRTKEASAFPAFRNRVQVIKGDSVSPEVIREIAQQIGGGTVLVTLDSLHTKEHVLKEMNLYSKFVTPGSYLIVQDTNINGHPVYPTFGPGPMEAVEEFLKSNRDYEVDRSREKYMLTAYPSGYLKKTR